MSTVWVCSYCEEIPVEENEVNDSSSKSSMEAKPDASPQLPKKSLTSGTASTLTSTGSSDAPASVCTPCLYPSPLIMAEDQMGAGRWEGRQAVALCTEWREAGCRHTRLQTSQGACWGIQLFQFLVYLGLCDPCTSPFPQPLQDSFYIKHPATGCSGR